MSQQINDHEDKPRKSAWLHSVRPNDKNKQIFIDVAIPNMLFGSSVSTQKRKKYLFGQTGTLQMTHNDIKKRIAHKTNRRFGECETKQN